MKTIRVGTLFAVSVVTVTALLATLLPADAAAFSGDGNGTDANPYKIETCTQLQEIADDLSADYALVANIDCTGTTAWNAGAGFLPIGTSTSNTFSGVLDGRNRTIDGLFIDTSGNNVGMFAYLSGTVKNLFMTNVDITSSSGTNHGSLAAEAIGATIEYVSVQGDFNGNQRIGGLVGFARAGSTISKSSFTGTSTDTSSYGAGFVGWLSSSTISDSYAQADYDGSNAGAGFVNRIYTSDAIDSSITRSYFVGDVDNPNYGATFSSQLDEFSSGQVTVSDSFVVGTGYNGTTFVMRPFSSLSTGTPTVSNFFYDQTAAGIGSCGGSYTCTAVNTDGSDPDHFKANSSVAPLDGWNFTDVWQVEGAGYPTLRQATLEPMGYGLNGDGSEEDPFQVTDCEELQSIDDYDSTTGVYFILMNNIDCSDTVNWNGGEGFVPIGESNGYFAGHFNGDGYTISDLTINLPSSSDVGLFGGTDTGSTIQDFALNDPTIRGSYDVGAVVGDNESDITDVTVNDLDLIADDDEDTVGGLTGISDGVTLLRVHVNGTIVAEDYDEVGGITGYLESSTASYASFEGDVLGDYEVGGLVGEIESDDSSIDHSYTTGTVTAEDTNAGGLLGEAEADGIVIEQSFSTADVINDDTDNGGLIGYGYSDMIVRNSYARGDVIGSDDDAGGFIGDASSSNNISNSYSTGAVDDGTDTYGGFVGDFEDATYANNFWDTQTSGQEFGCNINQECDGITGKTTSQMKHSNTFIKAGWDFDTIWAQTPDVNDGYPCLQWQEGCSGFTNQDGEVDQDNDSISDEAENAGPNGGDANNDETADGEQSNVASMLNPVTGEYAVLEVDEQCAIESFEVLSESEVTSDEDADYDYPAGMMDFLIDCGENGFTSSITQYYYAISGDLGVRKFKPTTGFFTIDSATTSEETIDGEIVKLASYQIEDGSMLDLNGARDGIIEDPAGLAEDASTSLANSGENQQLIAQILAMIFLTVVVLALRNRYVQQSRTT